MPRSIGRARRPKARYGMILLAGVVLVALLVAARLAAARFAWWKETSFAGIVLRKEARDRATNDALDEADAVGRPAQCRFYLELREGEETGTHEVTLSVFRKVAPGDEVRKEAGTWRWEHVPGSERGVDSERST
jgi:hypothetical protein